MFLRHLLAHASGTLRHLPETIVVGQPVRYVGARPDAAQARRRYDAMFRPAISPISAIGRGGGKGAWLWHG